MTLTLTPTLNRPKPQEFAPSALLQALRRLEKQAQDLPGGGLQDDPRNPLRVSLRAITTAPEAFNVRGDKDHFHLGQLVRPLSIIADLAPVLVIRCGDQTVLVDGHYRLEAYRVLKRPDIPVEYFQGTVREAYLAAVTRNAATTLQMDATQRMDCAWNMVNAGFSRTQMMRASGVSRAQVAVMWKTQKALGENASQIANWRKASREAAGKPMPLFTEDEAATFVEAQAQDYAGRTRKSCGTKPWTNPEIGARMIAICAGRMLPAVMLHLKDHLTTAGQEWITTEEADKFW